MVRKAYLMLWLLSVTALNGYAMPLTSALDKSVPYLKSQIPADGAKVLVLNFTAETSALSNYLADEIKARLVNDDYFTVVEDRQGQGMAILRAETNYQMTGEVSDETAASIGNQTGARSIIFGSMERTGSMYRLHIRTIAVETATIPAMESYVIGYDKILGRLLGKEYTKFYSGVMPGFSAHLFDDGAIADSGEKGSGSYSFDGALIAEYFINELFFLQTGLFFTADTITISEQKNAYDDSGTVKYTYETTGSFATQSLLFPLLAGISFYPLVFSPGIYAAIQGGLYADIPINNVYKDSFAGTEGRFTRNILFGWTLGGSAGVKFGQGIIFFDVRYSGDFMNAKLTMNNTPHDYKRNIIAFGVGYKIGYINQKI
jgi:hypothetical protein